MNKIRKGDEIIVITGRDKGKRGTDFAARRTTAHIVLVDGINLVKKHTKPNPLKGTTGGIVEKSPCRFTSPTSPFSMRPRAKADRVGHQVHRWC